MRQIILDTETTGLEPAEGHRVIEIGCVELVDRRLSGQHFHQYLNPERDIEDGALEVHGISREFLLDKPVFADVVAEFLEFIEGAELIIHNAPFDVGFINMELGRLDMPQIIMDRVVDTLALARRKHPAGPNTLDALCKRYGIDNSVRTKHGAIVDSLLLAEVYVELLGERQADLGLASASGQQRAGGQAVKTMERPRPLPSRLTAEDIAAHEAFVETLGEKAIWMTYKST